MLKKLYIEPTTLCNLNCKMCFRHTWFDEKFCHMSMENFRRALETMPRSVETVFFGGMGEPLYHPDIIEMIHMAAATGADVELLTNGTMLSNEMIEGILDAGLSRLWISIDDLETDSSINEAADLVSDHSGHGHSGLVLSNIRSFNKLRQKKLSSVSLGITFVAMKSNVHQLAKLPFFIAQHLIDEVNISNISPTDKASQDEMLYTNMVNMYTGPAKGNILPTVRMPYMDMNIPEAAEGIRALMSKQNFELYFNDQPVLRKTNYCKFVREGMCFVRSDGEICPCMPLLHNGYTWLANVERKIYHCSFGNIANSGVNEIWNSIEYRTFRRKFDEFDFSPCMYCGHCERFSDNTSDCFGNTHPTCGGCLWAEGVLSCP
ncbi:MAG: radical SAM protein [Oscillospiraceae bacterium]|nr:radical SAM protein [Oscillospiraceae bacterium]